MKTINDKIKAETQNTNEPSTIYTGPPVIRITLANVEETSMLLGRGLDFYGATYFPTETPNSSTSAFGKYKNSRYQFDLDFFQKNITIKRKNDLYIDM